MIIRRCFLRNAGRITAYSYLLMSSISLLSKSMLTFSPAASRTALPFPDPNAERTEQRKR